MSQRSQTQEESRTKDESRTKRRESRNAISEMSRLGYQTGYMERSIDSRHNCIAVHVSGNNECV